MSTTVLAPSGLEITSNHESGQSMLDSLMKTPDKTPRVLIDKGKAVKPDADDEEKDETSQAAAMLGKKGGKAAAEARKAEIKAAKPAEEKPDAKEAKPADEKVAKGKAEGTDEGEEKDADGKPLGKPRNDPRARIQQLARERDEQKARADAAEARAAAVERAKASPAKNAPAERPEARQEARSAPADDPEPKEADFEDYADYVKATSRWAARDENRKVHEQETYREGRRQVAQAISTHVDTFHERVTGLKKGDEGQAAGFGEFMAALPDALVSKLTPSFMIPRGEDGRPVVPAGPANLITDLIIKADKPREILEHFADNVNDFQRIAALRDPLQIAGEMAILSHRLDAVTADTSSQREVSRAGSPGRSVLGSPRAAEVDLSNADFEEHMRRKQAARK